MTNGITIEGETSEDAVGRENEAHEIFEGTLESNWKGTEKIYLILNLIVLMRQEK